MPTKIHLGSHQIEVEETLNEVEGKLRQAPPSKFAPVTLTKHGRPILLNAAQVRSVEELPEL